ncbi:collagen adhesion protein [Listeria floridensis FSL S10-1187]|uniref:Collagen adhesion protein n=1 Tax=Listeria floridensis FSL S10-1187 TaxID=1265817 RepID=A0ABP3B042_9LIST|nr:SpaA isopeptide-forming pilin-related protein [Listeria floridensis]EUJ33197.1 collagen adhesion protein [Listeria floridensis FSL S10-1187]
MKKIGILVVILFLLVPLGFSNVQADTMGNNSRTINSSISVNPDPIQGRNNVTVSANISGSAGDFQASNGEAVITIPKKTVADSNELKPNNVLVPSPFVYDRTEQDEFGDYQIIVKLDPNEVDENEAINATITIDYSAPLFQESSTESFKIEYAGTSDKKDVEVIGEDSSPNKIFYKWYQYSTDPSREIGLLDINDPAKNRFVLAVNYSELNLKNVVVTDTLPPDTELTYPNTFPGASGDTSVVDNIRILKVQGFDDEHKPTGFTYVTDQYQDKISYDAAKKEIRVDFGDISSDEAYLVEYALEAQNLDMGKQINTANLTADGYDLTKEFPVMPLLTSDSSFSLKKSVDKSKINIGEHNLEYTLEFGVKSGANIPAGITITDPLPDKMTITEITHIDEDYFDYTVSEDGKLLTLVTKKEITKDSAQKVSFNVDIEGSMQVGDQFTNVGILHISDMELNTNSATTVVYDGRVQIIKVDDTTGERLAGATFEILDESGTVVYEGTTNEKGELLSTPLAIGNYQVVETKAPEGYELSKKVHNIEVTGSETEPIVLSIDNTLQTGSVTLIKTDQADSDLLLPGAEFSLLDEDGKVLYEKLTTDENGEISVDQLKPGKYSFVETKAPEGYLLDETPISFVIEKGQNETLKLGVTNQKDAGAVELTKVDKKDHTKRLADAEFKLVDEAGKTIKEDLTTDSNGMLTVSDLAPGKYAFIETKAPKGYELDETPISFNIQSGEEKAVQVTVENVKQTKTPDGDKGTGGGNSGGGSSNGNSSDSDHGSKLPSTGDVAGFLAVMLGLLLIVAASRNLKKKTR